MARVSVFICGRVQGVFYRDFVRQRAERLGIEGTVQNLDDGTVMIYACGSGETLDDFLDILYEGSPKSKVDRIEVAPLDKGKEFRGVFRVIGFRK